MNKKSKQAAIEAVPKPKAGNGHQAKQDAAPQAAREEPAKTPEFDFIGKVESIGVGAEAGKPLFTFGLKGHGERRSFRITGESLMFNAMTMVVTAAQAAEAKIGVRLGADEEVVDVQSGPRLGKDG